MTASHLFLQQVETTIHALEVALLQFKECLDNEKAILEENNLTQLEELLKTKQTKMNEVQNIICTLQTLVQEKKTAGSGNILQLIKLFPSPQQEALLKKWEAIKISLTHCESLNFTNGAIIMTLKNYNDAFLNLLTHRFEQATYQTAQTKKSPAPISTREHKA